MINRRITILISSLLGVILTIGFPALAAENEQASASYSQNATTAENNNYIVSKENTIEQNGLKISIDKIMATKHKLKTIIKVESEQGFDETVGNYIDALFIYENNIKNDPGMSYSRTNDKTFLITLEKEIHHGQIPEKGNLKIDIIIPKYKINLKMNANVDFSEEFKNTIEKNVEIKMPQFDFTVNKLESNIFGTEITYSKQKKDNSNESKYISDIHYNQLILKVGDKMYPTMKYENYALEDTNVINGIYKATEADYDKVKGQNISLIPIICSLTEDETSKFYENNYKNFVNNKNQANKETTNNISYTKNFNFSDGTKGQIYNIERSDNTVKVYCKGATELESLLMANSATIYYTMKDVQNDLDAYYSSENMTFYKDPKDSLGYIVEFNNVKNDKALELNFNDTIKLIDKFKVENEVQLPK